MGVSGDKLCSRISIIGPLFANETYRRQFIGLLGTCHMGNSTWR